MPPARDPPAIPALKNAEAHADATSVLPGATIRTRFWFDITKEPIPRLTHASHAMAAGPVVANT
jgi:hypothetical protein